MKIIIGIALVAFATAAPFDDMGGKGSAAGGVDKMWSMLGGMFDKKAGGMGDMSGKDGMDGMDSLIKKMMGHKKEEKKNGTGVDDLWGVLSAMGGKKDEAKPKGGDSDEQHMTQLFEMMVKKRMEMGDLEGALELMAHKEKMGMEHESGGMNMEDMELKQKAFSLMLTNKMMKGDIDGIMKLMYWHKMASDKMEGRHSSQEEIMETLHNVYEMMLQHAVANGEQEAAQSLLKWKKMKMDNEERGVDDRKTAVKKMFLTTVYSYLMEQGDLTTLTKVKAFVEKKDEEEKSGMKIEWIMKSLVDLMKMKLAGGKKMSMMSEEEIKEESTRAMMFIDKLESFKEAMYHHEFYHVLEGEKPMAGGDKDKQDMMQQLMMMMMNQH